MVKQLYANVASPIKTARGKQLIFSFALISGAAPKIPSLWKQIKSRRVDVDFTYRSDIALCWTGHSEPPEGSGGGFFRARQNIRDSQTEQSVLVDFLVQIK